MDRGILKIVVQDLPEIMGALFSARNKERLGDIADHIEDISEDAKAATNLILEIFADILQEKDIYIPRARSASIILLRGLFEKEIDKRSAILPFEADPK